MEVDTEKVASDPEGQAEIVQETVPDPMVATLARYWQVPAIAHFCSLFRNAFVLPDFDIDDLEEALASDCLETRSTLIVDLLIGLLRGCIGRKDVTLLNYNQSLHALLDLTWVKNGIGPYNPLGPAESRACFHIMSPFAKSFVIYYLCELRIDRPDVENLTKNLSGDNLRVNPLGIDADVNTYWYFYGTRLYMEAKEPERPDPPLVLPEVEQLPSTPRVSPRKRGRRRRVDGFAKSKARRKTAVKKEDTEGNTSDDESTPSQTTDTGSAFSTPAKPSTSDADGASPIVLRLVKTGDETDWKAEKTEAAEDMAGEAHQSTTSQQDAAEQDSSNTASTTSKTISASLIDTGKEVEPCTEKTDVSTEKGPPSDQAGPAKNPAEPVVTGENKQADDEDDGRCWWDQPPLRPSDNLRWNVQCRTRQNWQDFCDRFARSEINCEIELHLILVEDFLPAIGGIFEQKERELRQKLLALAPRRSSERLDVKRLTAEKEAEELRRREQKELEEVMRREEEKRERKTKEDRETRRAERLREKSEIARMEEIEDLRTSRARRLELRQLKAETGGLLPEDFEDSLDGVLTVNRQSHHVTTEATWEKLEHFLDEVYNSQPAWPFIDPVTDELAPRYSELIKRPMCLSVIQDKLLRRVYRSKLDFVEDLNLLLLNCLAYNGLESDYTKLAQRLERTSIRSWKRIFSSRSTNQYEDEDEREIDMECLVQLGALDRKVRKLTMRIADDTPDASIPMRNIEIVHRSGDVSRSSTPRPSTPLTSILPPANPIVHHISAPATNYVTLYPSTSSTSASPVPGTSSPGGIRLVTANPAAKKIVVMKRPNIASRPGSSAIATASVVNRTPHRVSVQQPAQQQEFQEQNLPHERLHRLEVGRRMDKRRSTATTTNSITVPLQKVASATSPCIEFRSSLTPIPGSIGDYVQMGADNKIYYMQRVSSSNEHGFSIKNEISPDQQNYDSYRALIRQYDQQRQRLSLTTTHERPVCSVQPTRRPITTVTQQNMPLASTVPVSASAVSLSSTPLMISGNQPVIILTTPAQPSAQGSNTAGVPIPVQFVTLHTSPARPAASSATQLLIPVGSTVVTSSTSGGTSTAAAVASTADDDILAEALKSNDIF